MKLSHSFVFYIFFSEEYIKIKEIKRNIKTCFIIS